VREIAITRLKHKNVVKLHAAFQENNTFYLVMDYLAGGSLRLVLGRNPNGVSTSLVRQWCRSMLEATAYIHHQRVCHRDIKAENFMLASKSSDDTMKLIDFGLSTHFKKGEKMTRCVGTPYSMAPEMLMREPYSERIDVWSVGCVAFELCTGHAPYLGSTRAQIIFSVLNSVWIFHQSEWSRHGKSAERLVEILLNRNHEERTSAEEIVMRDPFLRGTDISNSSFGSRCCLVS